MKKNSWLNTDQLSKKVLQKGYYSEKNTYINQDLNPPHHFSLAMLAINPPSQNYSSGGLLNESYKG